MLMSLEISSLRLLNPDTHDNLETYCEIQLEHKKYRISKTSSPIKILFTSASENIRICLKTDEEILGKISLSYKEILSEFSDSITITIPRTDSDNPEARLTISNIKKYSNISSLIKQDNPLPPPQEVEDEENETLTAINDLIMAYQSEIKASPVKTEAKTQSTGDLSYLIKDLKSTISALNSEKSDLKTQLDELTQKSSDLNIEITHLKEELLQNTLEKSQSSSETINGHTQDLVNKIQELEASNSFFVQENAKLKSSNLKQKDNLYKLQGEINRLEIENQRLKDELESTKHLMELSSQEVLRLGMLCESSQSIASQLQSSLENTLKEKSVIETEMTRNKSLLNLEKEKLEMSYKLFYAEQLKKNAEEMYSLSYLQSNNLKGLQEENSKLSSEAIQIIHKNKDLELAIDHLKLAQNNIQNKKINENLTNFRSELTVSELNSSISLEQNRFKSYNEQLRVMSDLVVLQSAKNKTESNRHSEIKNQDDILDQALREYLGAVKEYSRISLVKQAPGVYNSRGKEVIAKLENGKISLKVGEREMTIEEFAKLFSSEETKIPRHKRRSSKK